MWNITSSSTGNEEGAKPTRVSTERTVVGMTYLMLVGALLSGVLHLIAS